MNNDGPRYPSEVSTRDRAEMVCPACFRQGLEENPAYEDEYSGTTNLLRATRCPDPECPNHGGLEPDEVREQLASKSMAERLAFLGAVDLNLSLILQALVVVGGLLLLVNQVFGLAFLGDIADGGSSNGAAAAVEGSLVDENGDPVTDATIRLHPDGGETTTDDGGRFRFDSVPSGQYTLHASPGDGSGVISGVPVEVSNGDISLVEAVDGAEMTGGDLALSLRPADPVLLEDLAGDSTAAFEYSNPLSADAGVSVTLEPVEGDKTEDTAYVTAGQSTTEHIPGLVTEQYVTLDTDIAERDAFDERTWNGDTQQVSVYGNLYPDHFTISVDQKAGLPVKTQQWNVTHDDTRTIEVEGGETRGEATLAIFGGTDTAENSKRGTWTGTDPRVEVDEDSAPSSLTVSLTGEVDDQQKAESGSLGDGGLLTYYIDGNLPAEATTIQFTGGQPENTTVADRSMQLSGEDGTREEVRRLHEVSDSGTYELDTLLDIQQYPDLVDGGYIVNSGRETVRADADTTELDLKAGDDVYVWLETRRETVGGEKDYSDSSPVIVDDLRLSDTNIDVGESITVYAELYNPQSSSASKDAVLFKNGNKRLSNSVSVGGGETKTVRMGTVSFDTEGAHTVSVSEGDQHVIEVGNPPQEYGEASLDAELTRIGDDGTIKVDTNGDGNLDCVVSADGGQCVLGQVPAGTNSITVAQEGVSDTSYTLSYTARWGAEDVQVDIDGDGEADMTHPGLLRDDQTVSQTFEIGAGTTRVDIRTSNGGDVPYRLEWTEAAVVNNPAVELNGEPVVEDVGQFQGRKEFSIGSLSAGTHELRFEAEGGSYMAEIEWTEQGSDRFPEARLNHKTICEPRDFADDQTCRVEGDEVQPGSHTLQFVGGAETFNYSVSQTARATAQQATLTANNQPTQFHRSSASTVRPDGSWLRKTSINGLREGDNDLSLQAPSINGIEVDATAEIDYTFTVTPPEEPTVIVVTPDDEQNEVPVPEEYLNEDGHLAEEVTLDIPAEYFGEGQNEVFIVSENGGTMHMTIEAAGLENGEDVSLEPSPYDTHR